MKTAKITFTRIPCEDSSIVQYDIQRGGRVVGFITAERHETNRARNGNSTHCTGAWTLELTDDNGRSILSEEDAEFCVAGFRPSRHWSSYATASTATEVARALREAKDAATAWLNAHPDYTG